MQDKNLRELVDEVSRLDTNLREVSGEAREILEKEYDAAQERLNLYIKEKKEERNKNEQMH